MNAPDAITLGLVRDLPAELRIQIIDCELGSRDA